MARAARPARTLRDREREPGGDRSRSAARRGAHHRRSVRARRHGRLCRRTGKAARLRGRGHSQAPARPAEPGADPSVHGRTDMAPWNAGDRTMSRPSLYARGIDVFMAARGLGPLVGLTLALFLASAVVQAWWLRDLRGQRVAWAN